MLKLAMRTIFLCVLVLISACVNRYAVMVHPETGDEQHCGSSGWGWWGAPAAARIHNRCMANLESRGYRPPEMIQVDNRGISPPDNKTPNPYGNTSPAPYGNTGPDPYGNTGPDPYGSPRVDHYGNTVTDSYGGSGTDQYGGTLPSPPAGGEWNIRLAKTHYSAGLISKHNYARLINHIKLLYRQRVQDAKSAYRSGLISKAAYKQRIIDAKFRYSG